MHSDMGDIVRKHPNWTTAVIIAFFAPMVFFMVHGLYVDIKKDHQQKDAAAVIEITLALQHLEPGDIVWFGGDRFRMMEYRANDFIYFKIPTCQGTPMSMDIHEVALRAKEVIKYKSSSVAWNNAAYMILMGYRPSRINPAQ